MPLGICAFQGYLISFIDSCSFAFWVFFFQFSSFFSGLKSPDDDIGQTDVDVQVNRNCTDINPDTGILCFPYFRKY